MSKPLHSFVRMLFQACTSAYFSSFWVVSYSGGEMHAQSDLLAKSKCLLFSPMIKFFVGSVLRSLSY